MTGAFPGIGRATANECSKMGAKLIVTGRNRIRLKETFDVLDRFYDQSHQRIIADLSSEEAIYSFADSLPPINGASLNAEIVLMEE